MQVFPQSMEPKMLSLKHMKILTQLIMYALFYHHFHLQLTMYLYLQQYTHGRQNFIYNSTHMADRS